MGYYQVTILDDSNRQGLHFIDKIGGDIMNLIEAEMFELWFKYVTSDSGNEKFTVLCVYTEFGEYVFDAC